jgi:heme O synthase-like polyprenyltransferase
LRNTVLAGIGGLLLGHTLWLVAISLAMGSSRVNTWVLVIAAVTAVTAAAAIWLGLRRYRQRSHVWAAFLWSLPVLPVLFTLSVLAATYL